MRLLHLLQEQVMNDPRSEELSQLIHQLAELPGTMLFDVLEKTYPRFGPAEPGTPFQQETHRYTPDRIPAWLQIPESVEEVVVTVEGALSSDAQRRRITEVLQQISEQCSAGHWDIRAWFEPSLHNYRLEIFTQSGGSQGQWE
jgi:hypothetical protein